MPHSEHSETRRGCPGIMKDHTRDEFDRLKKGDMVFTNFCKPGVLAARERGVYVVCVTVNYTNNEYRPPWFTAEKHRHPDGLVLRDVSDVILHSHLPYWGGLVRAPEIPELALCQSTTTGSGAVHWMLNAEITSKLANEQAKAIDKSAEYLRVLTERVERVAGHMDRIREAAVTMAHRIRAGVNGRERVRRVRDAAYLDACPHECRHIGTLGRIRHPRSSPIFAVIESLRMSVSPTSIASTRTDSSCSTCSRE